MLSAIFPMILLLLSGTSVTEGRCRKPRIPVGGGYGIFTAENSTKFVRFHCQDGYHLVGGSSVRPLCGIQDDDDVPRCAVDVTKHESVRVRLSSGVFPGKSIDENEDRLHKGTD